MSSFRFGNSYIIRNNYGVRVTIKKKNKIEFRPVK